MVCYRRPTMKTRLWEYRARGTVRIGLTHRNAFKKPIRTARALYEGSYALPHVSSYRACVRSESHVFMGRIPCCHLRMHREKDHVFECGIVMQLGDQLQIA